MNTETYKLGEELDSFNYKQVQELQTGTGRDSGHSGERLQCGTRYGCLQIYLQYGSARAALYQEDGSLQGTEYLSEGRER